MKKIFVALRIVSIGLLLVPAFVGSPVLAQYDYYSDFGGYDYGGYSDFGGYDSYTDFGGYGGYTDFGGYGDYTDYSGYGDYTDYGNYGGYTDYNGYGDYGYSDYSAAYDGYSDYSGYGGYSDYTGYDGYSDYSGYDNYTDYSAAYDGYNDYSGYDGYNDYSGYDGYNDYSGYDGYNDYSGYDGYNDYSPYDGYNDYGFYDGYNDYNPYDGYNDYNPYDGYSDYTTPYDYNGYGGSNPYNGLNPYNNYGNPYQNGNNCNGGNCYSYQPVQVPVQVPVEVPVQVPVYTPVQVNVPCTNCTQPTGSQSLAVNKLVRNGSNGETTWSDTAYAAPGDVVYYLIEVINNTNTPLQNVIVKDVLPQGIGFMGELKIDNQNANGDLSTGLPIGNLNSQQKRTIIFAAQVAPQGFTSGETEMVNTATAQSGNASDQASARVLVRVGGVPTNVPTGITNNLLLDSFVLPLAAALLGIWLFKSKILRFDQWLDFIKSDYKSYKTEKLLKSKIAKIKSFEE